MNTTEFAHFNGERLAELRREMGLTQVQLAQILGLSNGSIGNYESGARDPRIPIIGLLATFFSVDFDELIKRPESKKTLKVKPRRRT